MKKMLRKLMLTVLLFSFVGVAAMQAQEAERITIKELNTYEGGLTSVDDIPNHPKTGELVEFTAVIIGYPRNSGLASYNPDANSIGRIHVFVVDTTAASEGKDGMYMQIVQSSGADTFGEFEGLERGDIIDVTGSLTFFGNTAQMTVDEIEFNFESVFDNGNERYLTLLEPTVVNMEDINKLGEDGYNVNLENYTNFANRYVKFEQATVINSLQADEGRPWLYIRKGDGNIYTTDTSLRFRNDRTNTGYRDGYNWRRAEDGPYVPPAPGTLIDLSGFLVINTFDPDGVDGDETTFNIAPWSDGVVWRGEGDDATRTTPDDEPNDLNILGQAPSFSEFSLTPSTTPTVEDDVTISIRVNLEDEHTLNSVKVDYNSTQEDFDPVIEDMTDNGDGTYSYTFPSFEPLSTVSFAIVVDFDLDVDGESINAVFRLTDGMAIADGAITGQFFMLDEITSISVIQRTGDGTRGDSPLSGFTELPMSIEATVVSSYADGFVIIHDKNEAWSGIAIGGSDMPEDIQALERGAVIKITKADINSSFTNSFLTNLEYTIEETTNNWEDFIPTVSVSDINNATNEGKPYDGMLVKIEDAYVYTPFADAPSNFGEWAIADEARDEDGNARSLRINNNHGTAAIRVGDNIPNSLANHVKVDAELASVYGVVHFSFNNPKLALRSLEDITPVEDFTFPVRTIQLFDISNDEGSTQPVVVNSDLIANWGDSEDFDGDDVTYIFNLYAGDDEELENVLWTTTVDSSSALLPQDDVDGLLASLNIEEGASVDVRWTVFLSDGRDTVQVSTISGIEYTPVSNVTSIERSGTSSTEIENLPVAFNLEQNYPNPFNPTTTIRFTVPEISEVRVSVYDVLGRQVAQLVNQEMAPGVHDVSFDASRLSSGMYIYRLEAGSFVQTRKMMLIK